MSPQTYCLGGTAQYHHRPLIFSNSAARTSDLAEMLAITMCHYSTRMARDYSFKNVICYENSSLLKCDALLTSK
jgi:hypothetical protein